jgi:hypothetical protein
LRNSCDISGQFAPEVFSDEFPGCVKTARAGIIAKPLPSVEHIRFLCPRERGKIREAIEPTLIVGNNGRDLGLLEHEFRDQNRVRVVGATPWKIPTPEPEPAMQAASKLPLV